MLLDETTDKYQPPIELISGLREFYFNFSAWEILFMNTYM